MRRGRVTPGWCPLQHLEQRSPSGSRAPFTAPGMMTSTPSRWGGRVLCQFIPLPARASPGQGTSASVLPSGRVQGGSPPSLSLGRSLAPWLCLVQGRCFQSQGASRASGADLRHEAHSLPTALPSPPGAMWECPPPAAGRGAAPAPAGVHSARGLCCLFCADQWCYQPSWPFS